ncbi:MAG: YwiC-like family protein [Chloroflexi bacterium]|nr:YwiC-like family protein [Chloroflexota bacterium]
MAAQAETVNINRVRLLIPKEYGAWAMLLVPFMIGMAVASQWQTQSFVLLISMLSLYVARYPLVLWARSRFCRFPEGSVLSFLVFLTIGVGLGLLLITYYGLYMLAWLAALEAFLLLVHLAMVRFRKERSQVGEFMGIASLALAAPAALYVTAGNISTSAALLWFLSFAYFGASVYYVRMKLARPAGGAVPRGPETGYRLHTAVYQASVLSITALLSILRLLPPLMVVSFVPITVQVALGFLDRRGKPNARRLGVSLVFQSILFAFLVAVIYRSHGGA